MKELALALLVIAAPPALVAPPPEPFCKRLPFDGETPPGIEGNYELIGKDPETGSAYTGVLKISAGTETFVLSRTVNGKTVAGQAWAEVCSPDKFQVLTVRYEGKDGPLNLSCYLDYDGDNFTRASCTTFEDGGLEAWYQSHDIRQ